MTEIKDECLGLVKGLKSQLEAELLAGLTEIPVTKAKSGRQSSSAKLKLMKQLYKRTSGCTKCDLHKDRINLVFGINNLYFSKYHNFLYFLYHLSMTSTQ